MTSIVIPSASYKKSNVNKIYWMIFFLEDRPHWNCLVAFLYSSPFPSDYNIYLLSVKIRKRISLYNEISHQQTYHKTAINVNFLRYC